MIDLGPNTHPGYCPNCSMKADIWIGTTPDREPKLKREDTDYEIF